MLAQNAEHNDRAAARLRVVKQALEEEGLAIRPPHFAQGLWGVEEGRKLFRKINEINPRPSAVICGNGTFAMGALLEALSLGINVPEEMTLFGFDDFELMKELPVPLSTHIPSEEIRTKINAISDGQIRRNHPGYRLDNPLTLPGGIDCQSVFR
ncbi:substrate-binding domain-containing protein [Sodalis glossinidius]|uniref:substrate-binding domain-containing protein n=1 Tax=Sodalis glossinidius TaxID=63612 RepID=UPI0014136A53|nr:substrate-binding domain-containing protein [Sodalis glossinidius]